MTMKKITRKMMLEMMKTIMAVILAGIRDTTCDGEDTDKGL